MPSRPIGLYRPKESPPVPPLGEKPEDMGKTVGQAVGHLSAAGLFR